MLEQRLFSIFYKLTLRLELVSLEEKKKKSQLNRNKKKIGTFSILEIAMENKTNPPL